MSAPNGADSRGLMERTWVKASATRSSTEATARPWAPAGRGPGVLVSLDLERTQLFSRVNDDGHGPTATFRAGTGTLGALHMPLGPQLALVADARLMLGEAASELLATALRIGVNWRF